MKKNILYLSYDGMTDPLGQSQVIPYLAGLSSKGYSITIVSCEKKEEFENHKEKIKQLLKSNNINWEPLPYSKSPPVISTLYDMFKIKSKAKSFFRETKFQIVHCRSYITALIGLSLKRKYNCKFVFDMRGFYADERVDGKLWNLKNPVYKFIYLFFKKKEREMLLSADYIISLTNNAKQIINSWKLNAKNELPIQVIPCCADLDFFSPDKVDKTGIELFKNKLKIPKEKFVLSYLGALGTWYMLPEMLDFFKALIEEKPNSHFLFITPESENVIIKEATEKNIPPGKISVIKSSRDDVPALLSLSDASIFFIKPVFSKRASSPTKQGEIMSMGIPIICNSKIGDTDQIIEESNAGIVIKNFDEKSYHEAIQKLISSVKFDTASSRLGAKKYFSLENGIELYDEVYKIILNG